MKEGSWGGHTIAGCRKSYMIPTRRLFAPVLTAPVPHAAQQPHPYQQQQESPTERDLRAQETAEEAKHNSTKASMPVGGIKPRFFPLRAQCMHVARFAAAAAAAQAPAGGVQGWYLRHVTRSGLPHEPLGWCTLPPEKEGCCVASSAYTGRLNSVCGGHVAVAGGETDGAAG